MTVSYNLYFSIIIVDDDAVIIIITIIIIIMFGIFGYVSNYDRKPISCNQTAEDMF